MTGAAAPAAELWTGTGIEDGGLAVTAFARYCCAPGNIAGAGIWRRGETGALAAARGCVVAPVFPERGGGIGGAGVLVEASGR